MADPAAPELDPIIAELNRELLLARVNRHPPGVYLTIDILADPFVPDQLQQAVEAMGVLAGSVEGILAASRTT